MNTLTEKRNATLAQAEQELRALVSRIEDDLNQLQPERFSRPQILELLQDRVTELFTGNRVYRH